VAQTGRGWRREAGGPIKISGGGFGWMSGLEGVTFGVFSPAKGVHEGVFKVQNGVLS
jgi:hypothetical protein